MFLFHVIHLVMDTDWHPVYNTNTNEVYPYIGTISIGNKVWLGRRSVGLKKSVVPDGCIVAANALVNRVFETENTLLADCPAIERKQNITRKQ